MNSRLLNFNQIPNMLISSFHLWIRPVIIVGVIVLSGLLAAKAPQRVLILIPALIPVIVSLILFFKNPNLGFLALVGSIFLPFSGPSGSNLTAVLPAGLFAYWLGNSIFKERKINIVSPTTMLPLFSLVGAVCIAFGVGQLPWYTFVLPASLGAQVGGLGLFILSAMAFFVVVHQVKEERWLVWMTWILLGIGAFHAFAWLMPGFKGLVDRLYSPGLRNGSLFWTWVVCVGFSQAIFNRKLSLHWRFVAGGIALSTLYISMFPLREWNSGWMPALAALGGVIFAAKPRSGILMVIVGAAGVLYKLQDVIAAIMIGDNAYSLGTRLDAWVIVLRIVEVNPIFGLGPANYNAYTLLFPIRGWAVTFNSHSQYIDLIAQTGVVGLIAFIWFFGSVGWLGWKMRDRVPEGFPRAYVYGAVGGVFATFVSAGFGDWVIPFFYNVGFTGFRASVLSWVFLGGLVALNQIYLKQTSAAVDTTSSESQTPSSDSMPADNLINEEIVDPVKRTY